uniref:Uncharacterized protein n=1 Tax=Globisporangium ultimum (strain ATCC 200006 / CBS 805.95 / DAOM BR144) TaxID=431595 RepID=K3X5W7_GLOUD
MTQVGLTPSAIVPAQQPDAALSSNRPTDPKTPEISLPLARLYWCILVITHALVAVFFYGHAAMYWHLHSLDSSNSDDTNTLIPILKAQAHQFFTPVVVGSTIIAICHAIAVMNALLSSLRSRELVFSPDIWLAGPDKKLVLAVPQPRKRDTWRSLRLLLILYDKLYRRGLDLLHVAAVIKVALQVFQAVKLSHFVASQSINRLTTISLILNCWYLPLMHYGFIRRKRPRKWRQPVLARLVQYTLDSIFDIIYVLVIPCALFLPYYRDVSIQHGEDGDWMILFPALFYYDDTWFPRAVAETKQIFVTSWLDWLAKLVPGLAIFLQLRGMQTLLQVRRSATQRRITLRLPAATNEAHASTVDPTNAISKQNVASDGKIRKFLDLVLVGTGLALLILHLQAVMVTHRHHDPGCLLERAPWGSSGKYSCGVLEISCARRRLLGSSSEISAPLELIDPNSVHGLVLSHCPALEVPPTIRLFSKLLMLKIHNSTIVQWREDAALTQNTHPYLTRIYLSLVNMTGIPEGLMASDFPHQVGDMAFCGTNLTSLPANAHEPWNAVTNLALENSPGIDEFPVSLAEIPLQRLSLAGNGIRVIPNELLESQAYSTLLLANNPLQTLPRSIHKLVKLEILSVQGTDISEFPTDDYGNNSRAIEAYGAGTPLYNYDRNLNL